MYELIVGLRCCYGMKKSNIETAGIINRQQELRIAIDEIVMDIENNNEKEKG